ncbi:MAG: tetratricopeptide repeat protein, partial [Lachnospiraceae bacterium]|nr:tetratricopeptide repeat protein [Lachnospiraceae bacterium]
MVLKCKICGGDVKLDNETGLGTCLYCGSNTAFPKVSDDRKLSMFNRGNHFRLSGEFDEALVIYEQIIQEDG